MSHRFRVVKWLKIRDQKLTQSSVDSHQKKNILNYSIKLLAILLQQQQKKKQNVAVTIKSNQLISLSK